MARARLSGGDAVGLRLHELRYKSLTATLSANKTLVVADPPIQYLDPGGSGRTITLPAEADSDGLCYYVVNQADAAEDLTVKDDGASTIGIVGQNEIGIFICNKVAWKSLITGTGAGMAAADVTVADAGSFITATEVEAALQEIYQHVFSVQAFIPLSLMSFREAANFDVGAITANGGVLASDTTPVLDAINAATDGAQRLLWAAANVDQVVTQVALPPDLDTAKDLVVHMRIVSGGTTNAVGFTLDSFFNEGDTKVVDTSGTNQTVTYSEVTATIAAADIPAGAQTLTMGLTPVAHGTDTLAMGACWIEYSKALLTS